MQIQKLFLAILAILLSLSLAGCSFTGILDDLLGGDTDSPQKNNSTDSGKKGSTVVTEEAGVSCYLDGILIGVAPVGSDGKFTFPTLPIDDGYEWTGTWYADADCTKVYDGGEKAYAESRIVTYTITIDYDGGTGTCPATYTVEDEDFLLPTPTKDGYMFDGWEEDGVKVGTVLIAHGSTGNRSFRAIWQAEISGVTCKTNLDGITPTVRVKDGNLLSVSTPASVGEWRFSHWENTTKKTLFQSATTTTVSTVPAMELLLGSDTVNLTAVYKQEEMHTYDISSSSNLTISIAEGKTVSGIRGGNIDIDDCTVNGNQVTIPAETMAKLELGRQELQLLATDGSLSSVVLSVVASAPVNVAVSYDTESFPNVVLHFDCSCGSGHTVRLDTGSAVTATDGVVLENYDKAKGHTVRLYCGNGCETAIATDGYENANAVYYTTTFTWGGKTWDYAIGSADELLALVEYSAKVRGVLNRPAEGASLDVAFLPVGDLANYETLTSLFSSVTRGISFPMLPNFSLSSSKRGDKVVSATLKISYPYGLNDTASGQEKSTAVCSWYVGEDGRGDTALLPIDALEKTVTVRTVYELEDLPYGYRPVFDGTTTADTKQVYETARSILCEIINDNMNGYEKVTAIYVWLGEHITYDTVTASSGNASYRGYTIAGALLDNVAVCDGFGSAFRLLCLMEGIECDEIIGLQNLADSSSGHAWNKVTIDGTVWGIDSTWARQKDTSGNNYVTMRYLFLDEATLVSLGHYENATVTDTGVDSGYTKTIADGNGSYYEWVQASIGYDLEFSDTDSLYAMLNYMTKLNLSRQEFYLTDRSKFQSLLNSAGLKLRGKSVTGMTSSNGTAILIIE